MIQEEPVAVLSLGFSSPGCTQSVGEPLVRHVHITGGQGVCRDRTGDTSAQDPRTLPGSLGSAIRRDAPHWTMHLAPTVWLHPPAQRQLKASANFSVLVHAGTALSHMERDIWGGVRREHKASQRTGEGEHPLLPPPWLWSSSCPHPSWWS